MRFLFLNQTFYPDCVATAQVLGSLAIELVGRGHQVTVLTSQRAYDDPSRCFPAYEVWKGIEIHRIGSTGLGKSAKWRRAVDFASFLFNCARKLFTLPRPDVVVALTSPPLVSVLGALYARSKGKVSFYYWIMDLNPDEAIAAGWLRAGSIAARVLEKLSRFSLRHATKVIALDRFMADRVAAKGIGRDRIVILPPWSDDVHMQVDLAGRDRFRAEHGLNGKFVVMYSGNHSPCHPLDTLLETAKVMGEGPRSAVASAKADGRPNGDSVERVVDTVFLFVGGGSEFAKVKRFATEHGLSNIVCLPYQPLEQLSASLSAADLHVVVMGDAFVGLVHPCKVYNILRMGVPILYIGPKTSHVSDIFGNLDGNELCRWATHGDVPTVVEHVRAAARQGKVQGPERFARLAAEFSSERLLPRLVAVLEGGEKS